METTVGGWAVSLVCYPSLNGAVLEAFFPYRSGAVWSDAIDPTGVLGIVVGVVILGLQLVYVGATIQFGPRFSNLTHRGLLTGGLYRFSRHPAYLSKNILWWLTFMPFLPGTGIGEAARRTVCLLCVNAIYLMRAKAEERMLLEDPAYREYHRGMERTALLSRLATGGEGAGASRSAFLRWAAAPAGTWAPTAGTRPARWPAPAVFAQSSVTEGIGGRDRDQTCDPPLPRLKKMQNILKIC